MRISLFDEFWKNGREKIENEQENKERSYYGGGNIGRILYRWQFFYD